MNTYQVATKVLEGYKKEKLSDERIEFLINQANEQLAEIAENEEVYQKFLAKVNVPENIDPIILWMLLMSDEPIVEEYIDVFNKRDYDEYIPVSDLADLLFHLVYLKKIEDTDTEGFDFLMEYKHPGKDEFDHYCVSNMLVYVEKLRQVEISF